MGWQRKKVAKRKKGLPCRLREVHELQQGIQHKLLLALDKDDTYRRLRVRLTVIPSCADHQLS